jgi:mannose-6-phosphate isomerase-like protein (cupin superfamily)
MTAPIDLTSALASFDALWSPRIAARINDYEVRIAKVAGEHMWHTHADTDEFFLVLDGELHIALADGPQAAERVVVLPRNSLFVVPRGVAHKPFSDTGASLLMFEPAGTSSVGDTTEPVPDHIDATTGHEL